MSHLQQDILNSLIFVAALCGFIAGNFMVASVLFGAAASIALGNFRNRQQLSQPVHNRIR